MQHSDDLVLPTAIREMRYAEQLLASDRSFGDHGHIAAGLEHIYHQFLQVLADTSPEAAELARLLDEPGRDICDLVLRDPLVRRVIEDGVCTMATGVDAITSEDLDWLLGAAVTASRDGQSLLVQSGQCAAIREGLYPLHVWTGCDDNAHVASRFARELAMRVPELELRAPGETEIAELAEALQLALRIVPELANSAFNHAFLVILGSTSDPQKFSSMTIPGLSGVIIVNPRVVPGVFNLAEALIHEALHLKFIDLEYVRPLFVEGFRPRTGPLVTPPWRADQPGYGDWPLDRILTSMHVYLSLSVFHAAARASGMIRGTSPGYLEAESDKCRTRAAWLGAVAEEHLDQLSPAGRDFVAFNLSVLREISVIETPETEHATQSRARSPASMYSSRPASS